MKNQKSTLLNELETFQATKHQSTTTFDVCLFDGGFLLHSFLSKTGRIVSMGNLARNLLCYVANLYHANEINICFDTYSRVSLKYGERLRRGENEAEFLITGPTQKPDQSCDILLKNSSFKNELYIFLKIEWQKSEYISYLEGKTLYVSYGGSCVQIQYGSTTPEHLQGKHAEADTLLAFHTRHSKRDIVIRASDTDVLIILLAMIGKHNEDDTPIVYNSINMDVGVGNSQRLIDVSQIYETLEILSPGLPVALPGLHSFTGSDYTAAFYWKGKLTPLKLLMEEDGNEWITAFREMSLPTFNKETDIEGFVCALYGSRDSGSTNVVRTRKILKLQTTNKNTGANDKNEDRLKMVDCGLLPPCQKVLLKKILRAQLVARMWFNADQAEPNFGLDPTNFGWRMVDGCFHPDWYSGSALPRSKDLETFISERETKEKDADKIDAIWNLSGRILMMMRRKKI